MAGFDPMAPVYTAIVGYLGWMIAGVVILAIAAAALKLWLPGLKGAQGEAKVGRVLDQLFGEVLHDIIIPDGRGGSTQIDHVALTHDGFLAIETKNYSGAILGREREAQWTQRLRGRSFRFQNPLRQNYLHVSALQALQLGVPVQGHVVFTNRARFPKGIPQGVSQLRTMRQELVVLSVGSETSPAVIAAWGRLKGIARTDKAARQEHLRAVREKHGRNRRLRIAGPVLALLAACLLAFVFQRNLPHEVPQPMTMHVPPATTVVRSVPIQKQRSSARTSVTRPPRRDPVRVAEIQWSDGASAKSEECNLATIAVLIDNSEENRRRRERACAARRSGQLRASE